MPKGKKEIVVLVLKNIVLKLFHTLFPTDCRGLLLEVAKVTAFPAERADPFIRALTL